MSRALNKVMVFVLAALLGTVTTFIFYPGLMSFDSIYQYRQVIGQLAVQNYHPPIMVYVWKLGHAIMGPGSLLVFNQCVYWAAIALIGIGVHQNLLIRFFVVLVLGLLPPLWIHSVTIWNDAGVMSAFLLVVGCSLLLRDTGSRWVLVVGLVALFYGLSAKETGLPAAVPLFFLLSDAWFKSRGLRPVSATLPWMKVSLLAVGAMVCTFFVSFLVGSIGVEKSTKWPTIAVWDLAAVSLAEDRLLLPESVLNYKGKTGAETLALLRGSFSPEVNGTLVEVVNLFPGEEAQKELLQAWLSLPRQYPDGYFTHRAQVFGRLLGVPPYPVHLAFEHRIIDNDFGLRLLNKDSRLFNFAITWISESVDTPVYRSWVYFALLLLGLCYSLASLFRSNAFDTRVLVYLGLSGAAYVLPLFVVAPAADFRYTLWMVACSAVMVCFFICRFWPAGNNGDRNNENTDENTCLESP